MDIEKEIQTQDLLAERQVLKIIWARTKHLVSELGSDLIALREFRELEEEIKEIDKKLELLK